jgi:hypothetical protein
VASAAACCADPVLHCSRDCLQVRRERERELQAGAPKDLPFGLYLLFSTMVGIAAVGSIFEYAAKNPIFGVVASDSVLYTPILGTFAVTGLPMCAWLFLKGVAAANAESERYDKLDGL